MNFFSFLCFIPTPIDQKILCQWQNKKNKKNNRRFLSLWKKFHSFSFVNTLYYIHGGLCHQQNVTTNLRFVWLVQWMWPQTYFYPNSTDKVSLYMEHSKKYILRIMVWSFSGFFFFFISFICLGGLVLYAVIFTK